MSPEVQDVLREWSFPLGVNLALCVGVIVYVRGWLALCRLSPGLIPAWRLGAFVGGMVSLWIAIGSPLEAFDDVSLSAHMLQHLLLMVLVPPLVLLGAPSLPLLHGLPPWIVRGPLGAFLRCAPVHRLGHFLTRPGVCWLAASLALLGWHAPAAFELALRSNLWHEVEHVCFLATSLLFWWPVVQPFPSEARWPRWSMPLYLFLGMLPGGALGAFLTFCDRVIYPSYAVAAGAFAMSAIEDQVLAGVLMWVIGTFVYAIAAMVITVQILSPKKMRSLESREAGLRRLAEPALSIAGMVGGEGKNS
jgi:putative membrane protein